MNYLFPFAFALNFFSMTGFMIVLGLFGKPTLAADFGIVQGATMALFYAFSANARNLLLNDASKVAFNDVFSVRIILLAPLSAISLFLSVGLANISILLAILLIFRRCMEWLCEVYLSQQELKGNNRYATAFIVLQLTTFIMGITAALALDQLYWIGILAWAAIPLFMLSGAFRRNRVQEKVLNRQIFINMLPHFGSTAITGVSVYVFRLLILLLVGKAVAGDLYTAFAIGSLMGSVFVNALGPSLAYSSHENGTIRLPNWLTLTLVSTTILGLSLFVASEMKFTVLLMANKSLFFWGAVGLSLTGGPIMLLAQRFRIGMLQLDGDRNVLGPDLVANLLIICFLPFGYYFSGPGILKGLYLFNALVAIVIYWSATHSNALKNLVFGNRFNKDLFLTGLAGILIFPLFFQLSGGIFNDSSLVFDTMGKLSRLPIPVSVFGCMLGLIVIGNYEGADFALYLLFFSFILMMTTTVISTNGQAAFQRDKFILLIQFILPLMGMIVGHMYGLVAQDRKLFQKSAVVILLAIVPVQISSTIIDGYEVLSPRMYGFSIYQQLQYVPTIFVVLYLYALLSLWNDGGYRKMLIALSPAMATNAILSASLEAMVLLWAGVLISAMVHCYYHSYRKTLTLLLILMIAATGLTLRGLNREEGNKKNGVTPMEMQSCSTFNVYNKINDHNLSNLSERKSIWKWYLKEMLSSPKVLLTGNPKRPIRTEYPSAHNYYLDMAYNFGALALLPMLIAMALTVKKVALLKSTIEKDPSMLGLVMTAFALLLINNFFKVGMRQPYPGIITFFMWGLLLSRLSTQLPLSIHQQTQKL